MEKVFLSLGSNVGDRRRYIDLAIEALKNCGEIFAVSHIYETPPWGVHSQKDYYNLCIGINTRLTPFELLHQINQIEKNLGRQRGKERWQPRTIDIDIIFYGHKIVNTETLIVPHSLMHKRKFVLFPLSEIASEFVHPVFLKSVIDLIDLVEDDAVIKKIE